jgi:hypothetical protein
LKQPSKEGRYVPNSGIDANRADRKLEPLYPKGKEPLVEGENRHLDEPVRSEVYQGIE